TKEEMDKFHLMEKVNMEVPHIPRRFSEGYGIKPSSIDDIEADLLITVDNGIAAAEAIKIAKEKGMKVIIMDHHLPALDAEGEVIRPEADILVDPEAFPETADFDGYCGAGLTLKLIEKMFPKNVNLITKASAFAAIGTVADIVPLKEDNRRIVRKGLEAMNSNNMVMGLADLIMESGLSGHVDSESIAFKLAPTFNASGRLEDEGGQNVLAALMNKDPMGALVMAKQLIEINEKRKALIDDAISKVEIREEDPVNFTFYMDPDGTNVTGIVGLIAGKLAESTGKPSFAFTLDDSGVMKGSARSDDEDQNNVYLMLKSAEKYLLGFGGHKGAAGFSFAPENLENVFAALKAYPTKPHDPNLYYDLDLDPTEAYHTLSIMDQMEPFGKGMDRPVFRIEAHFSGTEWYQTMGEEKQHLRFDLPGNLKAVAFHLAEQYEKDGFPMDVYLYGTLCWNYYKDRKYTQFRVDSYEVI
ncbi:MAG: ssDNA exonuclease RecJ2, partial [Lachnospiraceae bacterium]|nr:ssDNA exonuclease RecJ2 [Lachnospiraceae bacterium]